MMAEHTADRPDRSCTQPTPLSSIVRMRRESVPGSPAFNFVDDGTILFLDREGSRVFFVASADPLGQNPWNNCRLFSIDVLGKDLRQLTAFPEDRGRPLGCSPAGGLRATADRPSAHSGRSPTAPARRHAR
jgi:hypothetical protein